MVHPLDSLKWAAVDFDGTLSESLWSPEDPTYQPGDPIWLNIRKLYRLQDAGYKIIIHTARPWADYLVIEAWLRLWNVPFDRIVCGKLLAIKYIDDRAVNADEESWV